jgi:hypothetical protein
MSHDNRVCIEGRVEDSELIPVNDGWVLRVSREYGLPSFVMFCSKETYKEEWNGKVVKVEGHLVGGYDSGYAIIADKIESAPGL